MYRQSLQYATELAEEIRQGSYTKKVADTIPSDSFMARPSKEEKEPEMTEMEFIANIIAGLREEGVIEGSDQAPLSSPRPRSFDEGGELEPLRMQAEELLADEKFSAKLSEMKEKYNLSEGELFRLIKGESGFNLRATNKSGAAGLFQFMPSVAKELGTTREEILSMDAGDQLELYDKYLDRWGYDGRNSLSILHAAPAYANASPDTVVYEKGTAAWEQNPGWRGEDGRITVASINDYYNKGRYNA